MVGWVSEWVRACVSRSVTLYLVDTHSDYSFCPINFKLHIHISSWWEEEPYWFWVTRSKVNVNFGTLCIRPCGHDTDYSFLPNHFQTSHISCGWWEEEPYWFWVKGQGQLWHSVYKALWAQYRLQFLSNHFQTSHVGLLGTIQTTVFVQSLSNFTCRLWMMREKPLLILGHRVIGQGHLLPPCPPPKRGCHALRCLVTLWTFILVHVFSTDTPMSWPWPEAMLITQSPTPCVIYNPRMLCPRWEASNLVGTM